MKKNSSDWKDRLGMVYSTNSSFEYIKDEEEIETLEASNQTLICKYENKGRGGKEVCIIAGFIGSESDLKALGKLLKNKCGVGGAVKDGEIIMQGNVRDKVMELLKKEGYKVKRVGG